MAIPSNNGLLQVFDVDHGACALLTMPTQHGTRRVMVDSGHSADFHGAPWFPGRHLLDLGVKHLDLLVCTNYDEDHASGPDGHPKLLHFWPGKLLQAGRGNYVRSEAMAKRAEASCVFRSNPPPLPIQLRQLFQFKPASDSDSAPPPMDL